MNGTTNDMNRPAACNASRNIAPDSALVRLGVSVAMALALMTVSCSSDVAESVATGLVRGAGPPDVNDIEEDQILVAGTALSGNGISFPVAGGGVLGTNACTVKPALPAGLTLATITDGRTATNRFCRITGTPTAEPNPLPNDGSGRHPRRFVTYTVTATSEGSNGSDSGTVEIIVLPEGQPATDAAATSFIMTGTEAPMLVLPADVPSPSGTINTSIFTTGTQASVDIPNLGEGTIMPSNGCTVSPALPSGLSVGVIPPPEKHKGCRISGSATAEAETKRYTVSLTTSTGTSDVVLCIRTAATENKSLEDAASCPDS